MGGGNGQKSAAARDRNNAKLMKLKKANKPKGPIQQLQCKKCLQTFGINAPECDLIQHIEGKHKRPPPNNKKYVSKDKNPDEFAADFKASFPGFGKEEVIPDYLKEKPKYKEDKPTAEKKKKFKKKG